MQDHETAAKLARSLGDPARLAMLHRLVDGPATVAELGAVAGQRQPNVSNHLRVLRDSGLVKGVRSGRQVSYELAGVAAAQLVETFLERSGAARQLEQPDTAIAYARTCYDHLAGRLGVAIFDGLVRRRAIALEDATSGSYTLGKNGADLFAALGIDSTAHGKRRYAYACLDWTARRPHLGGLLGARLCDTMLDRGWVTRGRNTRAVALTDSGRRALRRHLDVRM